MNAIEQTARGELERWNRDVSDEHVAAIVERVESYMAQRRVTPDPTYARSPHPRELHGNVVTLDGVYLALLRAVSAAILAEPLVVVPCGGQKLTHAAPAGEMYTGSYHKACRRAAQAISSSVVILSAKHGLLFPDRVIEPYEMRIEDQRACSRKSIREQAIDMGIADADAVILAGAAYTHVALAAFPTAATPLAGSRGIGDQLARLKRISEEGLTAVGISTTV